MNADSSEAKKTNAFAMSSGSPKRGIMVCFSINANDSGGKNERDKSVKIKPGAIALQRSPCLPYCVAVLRVNALTAALDEE